MWTPTKTCQRSQSVPTSVQEGSHEMTTGAGWSRLLQASLTACRVVSWWFSVTMVVVEVEFLPLSQAMMLGTVREHTQTTH